MNAPGLARTYSMSIVGIEGHLVDVETYAGSGLVAFTLVGLLDTSVREARDRVRAAFESCGLDVLDQRITVNLSPAGIPKSGSAFDLAIAASVALATGLVSPLAFEDTVIIGELALDGSIQPVRGVLPAVLAARSRGVRRVIVPTACAREASLVSGIEAVPFAHLADLIAWAGGEAVKAPFHGRLDIDSRTGAAHTEHAVDMSDVRGQPEAVAAMEVAAAGGHHVFLLGEPGSGKTMLASRLPTILPDLDPDTALVTTSLHSVAGLVPAGLQLLTRPPLQAPHHSVTMPALIGGGSRSLAAPPLSPTEVFSSLTKRRSLLPRCSTPCGSRLSRGVFTCIDRGSRRPIRRHSNSSWPRTRARAGVGGADAGARVPPSIGAATSPDCPDRCLTGWTSGSTCTPPAAPTWPRGQRRTRRRYANASAKPASAHAIDCETPRG